MSIHSQHMANDGKKRTSCIFNMPNTNGKTHINRVSLKRGTKKREQYIIYLINSRIYVLQGPPKEVEEKIIFFN